MQRFWRSAKVECTLSPMALRDTDTLKDEKGSEEGWLPIPEAAARAGISRRKAYRLAAGGKVPTRGAKGNQRVRVADLDRASSDGARDSDSGGDGTRSGTGVTMAQALRTPELRERAVALEAARLAVDQLDADQRLAEAQRDRELARATAEIEVENARWRAQEERVAAERRAAAEAHRREAEVRRMMVAAEEGGRQQRLVDDLTRMALAVIRHQLRAVDAPLRLAREVAEDAAKILPRGADDEEQATAVAEILAPLIRERVEIDRLDREIAAQRARNELAEVVAIAVTARTGDPRLGLLAYHLAATYG